MSDVDWMFAGVALLTTDGYRRTPFTWGGALGAIKWKGNVDQRAAALQEAKVAFSPFTWLVRGDMCSRALRAPKHKC